MEFWGNSGDTGPPSLPMMCVGVILRIAGVAFAQYARTILAFSDWDQSRRVFASICGPDGVNQRTLSSYQALLGERYTLISIGVAIASTGLTVLIAIVFQLTVVSPAASSGRAWDLVRKTPSHRPWFVVLWLFALVIVWAGEIQGLQLDSARQLFPPCSDTIIFPAAGLTLLLGVLAVLGSLVGLLIFLGFGRLPVSLLIWDPTRRNRSIAVTAAWLILSLVVATMGVLQASSSSSFATPAYWLGLYLLASTRAALLAPSD